MYNVTLKVAVPDSYGIKKILDSVPFDGELKEFEVSGIPEPNQRSVRAENGSIKEGPVEQQP